MLMHWLMWLLVRFIVWLFVCVCICLFVYMSASVVDFIVIIIFLRFVALMVVIVGMVI